MRSWTAILAAVVVAQQGVWAQEDPKLIPGVPVEFEVVGLPPSLAILARDSSEPVRMSIRLPPGYNTSDTFPVLVWLGGGDGGMGGELHVAEPFLGRDGYVLVNMPLFKADIDGASDDQKLVVTPFDGPYALPAYQTLFGELKRLVPNIDASRGVLAGFSNGAYTIAMLIWVGDADLLSMFSSFVLIEGGFWLHRDHVEMWPDRKFQPATFASIQGKRVLVMHGDQTVPPDRIPWNADAAKSVQALQKAGIDATLMSMANVGHEFPPDEIAKAREWVIGR